MTDLKRYRIEEEPQTLLDSLDACPGELRPELEQRIAEYIGAEVDKIDRIGAVRSSLDNVQAHAKTEIERLWQRQQSAEKNASRLEAYILHILKERDGRPLNGNNIMFSIRRTEALAIVDPELVPDNFKRTTITVDVPKTPIKEALKGGEQVPGVVVEVHEHLVKR